MYQCSGFALATILGCAVLFVTVLTLDALSSVSEQAVKRAKNRPFLLLGHKGVGKGCWIIRGAKLLEEVNMVFLFPSVFTSMADTVIAQQDCRKR